MIKLFAWEARTSSRLDDSRAEEVLKIRSLNITRMITRSAKCVICTVYAPYVLLTCCHSWFVPVITMGATFFTYVSGFTLQLCFFQDVAHESLQTVIMKRELTGKDATCHGTGSPLTILVKHRRSISRWRVRHQSYLPTFEGHTNGAYLVFNVIRQQLVFLFHTLPALIRGAS